MLCKIHDELSRLFSSSENMDDIMFGQIFMKYVDFFKIYTNYCDNQDRSNNVLKKATENNSEFEKFLHVLNPSFL